MTARDEILDTISQHRLDNFTIQEIIDLMQKAGTRYEESTIRTHISSKMCKDAPVHHQTVYNDLVRIGHGLYRLNPNSSQKTSHNSVMKNTNAIPRIVKAGQGESRTMPGVNNVLKIPAKDTGGAYSIMFDELAPNAGPPPHVHENEDEIFLIADGKFEFWIEGETHIAEPGDVVFAPRGCKHTFRNIASTPSHCWIIVNSSTFESFLKEFYAHMSTTQPSMETAMEIGAKSGITFLI